MSILLETHIPAVSINGLNTNKAVAFGSTLAVTGASTFASTTQFTGVSTFTVAPVFTVAPSGPTVRPVMTNALVGATVVLTAADSGKILINRSTSGTPSWTLPTAADGLWFTFLVTSTTAGFTVTGGTIFAKTSATGTSVTGTTLTNTQGTAVVGDTITLVCNGTDWRMISQSGIFTAA